MGKEKVDFISGLLTKGEQSWSQIGRAQGLMEMCHDIDVFRNAAEKQKKISIAPYLFDEMNRDIIHNPADPKTDRVDKENLSGFNENIKQALDYNPKE